MAEAKLRGRFIWQELMTEDTAAAAAFYTRLLGWSAQPSSVDPSYTLFSIGSRGVAGLMKIPDSAKSMGAKPMWMPYIAVEEVDPAVTQLESLGGKVLRAASDIPTVGRFAIVTDPQEAVFALFKPSGPPPGSATSPHPGAFSWMELATTDQEAAFTFYAKLFGWQALHRHDMGPMGSYLIFGSDGLQLGGMFKMGAERGPRPSWLAYAAVPDADLSAKQIPAFGGRVLNGPMDVPDGGRIVQLADPGGAMFALHAQVKPKAATPPAKPAPPPPAPKAASPPKPAVVKAPPTLKPAATQATKIPAKKAPAAKKPAAKKPAAKKPAARKVAKKASKGRTHAKPRKAKHAGAKRARAVSKRARKPAKKKPAKKKSGKAKRKK